MILRINHFNDIISFKRTDLGLFGAATVSICLLASHPAQADEIQAAEGEIAETFIGILETSAGKYEFTPDTCAIHQEEGGYDIEIGGRGIVSDGEEFYFTFSSTGNEMTIGLVTCP